MGPVSYTHLHEMGVLLGDPVEDVRGFMEQNGQNALYQGYWKVYAHVPEKKRLFARYDMEKETIIQLLSNGVGMLSLIHILRYLSKRMFLYYNN